MLRQTTEFILDLLFPITCQSCGAEGEYLCLNCQGNIEAPDARCLACSRPSPLGQIHDECHDRDTHLRGLLVASDYHNEAIRRLIWNLKYSAVPAIAETLGQLLADYLIKYDLLDHFAAAAVVPVPLWAARQRERGYNQAALLAGNLASRLGLRYLPILRKTRKTKSQVDLPREARMLNVKDSFAASATPSLGERKILLVDDVATTGSTLNECAKELKKQRPAEIWALVVARN